MIDKKDYRSVSRQLQDYLETRFPDVRVEIGDGIHYKGTNVVVTSKEFAGLLAEQRFHHVVRAIPKEFYEEYLQRGVVWFELAPGETGADLMKMPRAVDFADEHDAARKQLKEMEFFKTFQEALEPDPQKASITRFEVTRRILEKAGLSERDVLRGCMFMIANGAFCDAHVLTDVLPILAADTAA